VSDPFDPAAVPIRPAATVMLIRDASGEHANGFEVFMLRRTLQAVFGGGMYVFPGGRLDDVDAGPAMEGVCDGLTDRAASDLLQIESGGLAYWVAAIRECFEEAGVLLGRSAATGDVIDFHDPTVEARFNVARHAIHDSSVGLVELCEAEGLRLAAGEMHYVANWVTPVGEVRRFDTRFFLARAPLGQEPLHDDNETIASLWVRPADALARERDGELTMMPPTIWCLQFLAEHATVDAVLTAAANLGTPPKILPKLKPTPPGAPMEVLIPGDPGYDDLP